MKFPVSVVHVEDRIFLFQVMITVNFKNEVSRILPSLNGAIKSITQPAINGTNIYLNGDSPKCNYEVVSCEYSEIKFNKLLGIINEYKKAMGYDE